MAVKRVLVVAASAFVAVNIWTGAPLLALWMGSRIVGRMELSMGAVGIVVAVLAGTVFLMTILLTRLNDLYRRMADMGEDYRQPPWLSPLASERSSAFDDQSTRPRLTPVELAIVISVQLAALAFLAWFLFLAGSPLPQ
ncbi:MAG TPA: hypothetical protein VGG08_01175 [Solirubrobacteraceae bacterium]|jgi:hypothetical protein